MLYDRLGTNKINLFKLPHFVCSLLPFFSSVFFHYICHYVEYKVQYVLKYVLKFGSKSSSVEYLLLFFYFFQLALTFHALYVIIFLN